MPRTKAKTKATYKLLVSRKKKQKKRRKASSAGAANQYAFPTSLNAQQAATNALATTTQQNLGEDSIKAQEDRERLDRTQKQRLQDSKQEETERADAIKAERDQSLKAAGVKTASYLGKMGASELGKKGTTFAAKRAAEKIANQAIRKGAVEAGKRGIGAAVGTSSSAVMPIALAAQLAGTGIEKLTGDEDDTTYNAGEIGGGLLKGAGTGAAYGATLGSFFPGVGNVVGGVVGGVVGAGVEGFKMLRNRKEARGEETRRSKRERERDLKYGLAQDAATRDAFTVQGRDLGYNVNTSVGNPYLGSNQMAQSGRRKYQAAGPTSELLGVLGNYDPKNRPKYPTTYSSNPSLAGTEISPTEEAGFRYLSKYTKNTPMTPTERTEFKDNLYNEAAANKGNPRIREEQASRAFNTPVEPESTGRQSYRFDTAGNRLRDKKIPNYELDEDGNIYEVKRTGGRKVPGGEVIPLSGGAVEFKGNKHFQAGNGSDSGIVLEESTADTQGLEVEDGETMDNVKFADGATDDYIFSSYMKLGGRSFAARHKEILRKGGSQKDIQQLAKMQEEKAKQVEKTPVGPTDEYGPRGEEYIARYGGVKPRKKAQFGLVTAANIGAKKAYDAWKNSSPEEQMAILNTPVLPGGYMPMLGTRRYMAQVNAAAPQTSDRLDEYNRNVAGEVEEATPVSSNNRLVNIAQRMQNDVTPETTPETTTVPTTATSATSPVASAQPGIAYEDALVGEDGVQYSTEDFKRKGRGSSIDYSGDINSDSWEDVLQTNWAEKFLVDDEGNTREGLSKKDVQSIYNDKYVPQVKDFFDTNPDAAYNATLAFADSGNPNASNLRKRIYNDDGTLKSKEEVLEIALKNATDGKVGTFHSVFTGGDAPGEPKSEETVEGSDTEVSVDVEKPAEEDLPEEVKNATPGVKAPKLRAVPPLAYATLAGNLVGPLAALATKIPNPTLVQPGYQGRERLARVNYNAERAAGLNNTTAFNRAIENSNLGPAGIVSKLAANEKSRQGALDIANQEARQNRQIDNAEKSMNQAITARNIQRGYDADLRNAAKMDQYALGKKQKNVQALSDIGTAGGQFATDVMRYQRDERVSTAGEIGGEYTRQRYKEAFQSRPKYRKMLKEAGIDPNDDRSVARIAAAAYDPNLTLEEQEQAVLDYLAANPKEEDSKRYGGRKYIKKTGSVKRKKRK